MLAWPLPCIPFALDSPLLSWGLLGNSLDIQPRFPHLLGSCLSILRSPTFFKAFHSPLSSSTVWPEATSTQSSSLGKGFCLHGLSSECQPMHRDVVTSFLKPTAEFHRSQPTMFR